jgi:hypothetical protein
MREGAPFLNGVYEGVLEEIIRLQEHLPEQILFLQPYSKEAIRLLKLDPPSTDEPMQILISPTQDLGKIAFVGEVVGWRDKRKLDEPTRLAISRVIWTLQPGEGGLYDQVRGVECTNLLLVRRMRHLRQPIPVGTLKLRSKGRTIAGKRSTAGGWAYVEPVAFTT